MGGDIGVGRASMSLDAQIHLTAGKQDALDGATGELVRAFRRQDVRVILLKGAATALRLYDSPAERSYVDVDLLVAPESLSTAQAILKALGFTDLLANARANERRPHASPWQRTVPSSVTVDLHENIHWCSEAPTSVWRELSAQTRWIKLGGTAVEVLRDPALALVVVTYPVEEGRSSKRLHDLERALVEIDRDAWREAAAIAERLGIGGVFETELRSFPAGSELADELGLASLERRLLGADTPPVSHGDLAIPEADGFPARRILGPKEAVPSPGDMLTGSRRARRTGLGLLLAYGLQLPATFYASRTASGDSENPG
jgi:hypothetical protein